MELMKRIVYEILGLGLGCVECIVKFLLDWIEKKKRKQRNCRR